MIDLNNSGSGFIPEGSLTAWVNFNGTGTVAIRASSNVSSVTDLGVGRYRINFVVAMPDINYSVALGSAALITGNNSSGVQLYTSDTSGMTTSSVEIGTGSAASGGASDSAVICVMVFR